MTGQRGSEAEGIPREVLQLAGGDRSRLSSVRADLQELYFNMFNHIDIIVDKGFLTWAPGLQPRDSPGGPTRAAVNAPLTGYIIFEQKMAE